MHLILVIVTLIAAAATFSGTWKLFSFFVPPRDFWINSSYGMLKARFSAAISAAIISAALVYGYGMKLLGIDDAKNESRLPSNQPIAEYGETGPVAPKIEILPGAHPNVAVENGNTTKGAQETQPPTNQRKGAHEHSGIEKNDGLIQDDNKSGPDVNRSEIVPGNSQRDESLRALAMPGEVFPETRLRRIDQKFIQGLNDQEIQYAINEMLARHGGTFSKQDIREIFTKKTWYRPDANTSNDEIRSTRFSHVEQTNLINLEHERNRRRDQTAVPPPKATHAILMRFIDSESNLRSGPGTDFVIIRTPRKGEIGTIKQISGDWIMLEFASGETGWAHQSNLISDEH